MTSIYDACDEVETREDLALFVERLLAAHRAGELENDRLDSFLDGLAGWTEDMPGYFVGRGESTPEQPSWNLIARMLLAATAYD